MENKFLTGILGVALVGVSLGALFLSKGVNVSVNSSSTPAEQGLGATELTINPSNSSYTDGADLRQNVQAIAEKMAGLTQYNFLQADSQGRMQAVDGLTQLTQAGTVAAYTASGTVTMAQVCSGNGITDEAGATTSTLTLPATSTLYATGTCLDDTGDFRIFPVRSLSASTGTIFAAGSGGTLNYSSSLTLSAGKSGLMFIQRVSDNAYFSMLLNANN